MPILIHTLSVISVLATFIYLRDLFSVIISQKSQYEVYLSLFSFMLSPSSFKFEPKASPKVSTIQLKSTLRPSATNVLTLQDQSNFPKTLTKLSGESVEHYDRSSV